MNAGIPAICTLFARQPKNMEAATTCKIVEHYNSSSWVLVFLHTSRIHKDAVLSKDAYSGYFAPFLLCKEHGEGPLTQLR